MTALRLVESTTSCEDGQLTLDVVARVLDFEMSALGFRTARCPAHDDRWGTLVMCEVEPGDVAFHCSGGCPEDRVRNAVMRRFEA